MGWLTTYAIVRKRERKWQPACCMSPKLLRDWGLSSVKPSALSKVWRNFPVKRSSVTLEAFAQFAHSGSKMAAVAVECVRSHRRGNFPGLTHWDFFQHSHGSLCPNKLADIQMGPCFGPLKKKKKREKECTLNRTTTWWHESTQPQSESLTTKYSQTICAFYIINRKQSNRAKS